MKPIDFKEFTAKVKDNDGDEHESTVLAHVVTNDTQGRSVATRTGSYETVEGNVLVQTDRPGVYDVLSADAWKGTGYGGAKVKQGPDKGRDNQTTRVDTTNDGDLNNPQNPQQTSGKGDSASGDATQTENNAGKGSSGKPPAKS